MSRTRHGGTARKSRAPTKAAPRWVWLIGGLLLGTLLSFGFYIAQSRWIVAMQRPAAVEPSKAKPKSAPQNDAKTAGANDRRFEFYTLLPEMEVRVTEDKFKEALRAPAKSKENETYILQVGSFRRMEEADSLKARLALVGVEAKIQTVVIRNDDVWYRVRVGPYDNLKEISQMSARLKKNDIDFMLLRLGA